MKNLVGIFAVLGLVACSSNSSSGSSSAVDQCNALAQSICTKILSCQPDAGTDQDCLTAFEGSSALNCSKATGYNDPNHACENALATTSCADLQSSGYAPPSQCDGIITN